jgi:drug/metabolite transporter (DMT)-like permease
MLFTYAISFSFAYVSLDTATGALILFATVQFSMLGINLLNGTKLRAVEWLGAIVSLSGFALLMLPGATQPSLFGFILMVISGIAWAIYTLEGKRSLQPVRNTAVNFWRSVPFAVVLLIAALLYLPITLSTQGILLAVASGVVASALGYTIWYSALRHLTVTLAALSQLTVPLIAAIGGLLWVGETLTSNLILSGSLILGGIFLVIIRPGVKT